MKKRAVALSLVLCLLLCGCSNWLDGSYVSVTPHYADRTPSNQEMPEASTYQQLRDALAALVEDGARSASISVAGMDTTQISSNMDAAVHYVMGSNPIGAYAVERIDYDQGMIAGRQAIAVNITYNYSRTEIRRIRRVQGMASASSLIAQALEGCEPGIVLLVNGYTVTDFAQLIQDYGDSHPEAVMEIPSVTANIYPDSGTSRVVELKFTYQTSRDALRSMQERVRRVFGSARLYVSSDTPEQEKFSLLASFLTNLTKQYDYHFETSITPSYSLLCHGVGDSKAYAVAYAAMCAQADAECLVVSGTRDGEPWFWNIIRSDGIYYHVDLLRFFHSGSFRELTDREMEGYVWDYSAYPACTGPEDVESNATQPDSEEDPDGEETQPPETDTPTDPSQPSTESDAMTPPSAPDERDLESSPEASAAQP